MRKHRGSTWLRTLIGAGLFVLESIAAPARAADRGDLTRLVVVGDSLSAGFQNFSLLATQQTNGYAAVVARQARTPLVLPLIDSPGIPNVLTLVDPGPPPLIQPAPGSSTGRLNPFQQVTNLAVPGATVVDALLRVPDCDFTPADAGPGEQLVDLMTDLILGLPGCLLTPPILKTQIEWAESLQPTTIIVWIGNNDVLGAALTADATLLTPAPIFKTAYAQLMQRLAATGATLVVGNLPDVTVIPFLTPAPRLLAELSAATGYPAAVLGAILGIGDGDFVIPDAFQLIPGILAASVTGPLPAHVVLDAGEVAIIRAATAEYNTFIAEQAAAAGAVVVDIHALLDRARDEGVKVGPRRLTTQFLGGLFSLDGIHPTDTGYAVIARAFIEALNRQAHADIPPVNVRQVMRHDPLVLPAADADHDRD
jgi:phospholipase/lecithinase/hemolysin